MLSATRVAPCTRRTLEALRQQRDELRGAAPGQIRGPGLQHRHQVSAEPVSGVSWSKHRLGNATHASWHLYPVSTRFRYSAV